MALVGAFTGISGVILLFYPELGEVSLSDDAFLGLMLGVFATFLASLGNLLATRNTATGLPVISVNAWGMLYGTAVLTLIAIITGAEFRFSTDNSYLLSLLYLAVFGSVLAFGMYLKLLAMIGPERAAYSSMLFPVVALANSLSAP